MPLSKTAKSISEAEKASKVSYREFFKNKTVIIISHRFSTVRNADRILVMENGAIIEDGTHNHLMAKNGYYAKVFLLQAEGYASS